MWHTFEIGFTEPITKVQVKVNKCEFFLREPDSWAWQEKKQEELEKAYGEDAYIKFLD